MKKVQKDQVAFTKFVKEDLTDEKKIRKSEDGESTVSLNSDGDPKIDYLRDLKKRKGSLLQPKDEFIFDEKSYSWLMEQLIPSGNKKKAQIADSGINIPETVVFENGKPKFFLKNDKDGKIVQIMKNKTELTDVQRNFILLCNERRKSWHLD